MSRYRVRITRRAERGLRRIRRSDPSGYSRVAAAIRGLADEPRGPAVVKLSGYDPPAWRLRVGGYRIVYEILDDELVVIVVNVAPRGEVYR